MTIRNFLTTVSVFAIAACSDSSSPPPPVASTPPPTAATSSSISSTGVITGFGSIVVNGKRHVTDATTVVAIEDEAETTGDDGRLRLGMRVKIDATETNGTRTASRIEYDEDIKGPATTVTPDANDPAIGTFEVAGQTVVVDSNTIFDDDVGDNDGVSGINIRDLDPANFGGTPINVEVSGHPTETGVLATRIDRVNGMLGQIGINGDEIEVKGFVDSVASDGSSFVINGATFLVSGTVFEDGLAADQSLVGVFVEVKADIDGGGNFVTVNVELEDDLDGAENNDEFEIEGVLESVDTIADPDVIIVSGVTIQVDNANSLVAQIGNRIEIEGSFNANGVLVINQTEIDAENTVHVEDRVTSVNTSTNSFTTRLGIVVTATTDSRVQDETSDDGDQLTPNEFIGRLMNDDFVEARGYPDNGGTVWTRIERADEDDRNCVLQGPVDSDMISDPTIVIQGVTINTTGLPESEFKDENDLPIGRAAFFSRLAAGDIVEAESDEPGTGCRNGELSTGVDGEVSFEDDDGVAGNDPAGGGAANDDEIAGTVRNLDAMNNTFEIAGRIVTVTPDTLIDDSIVERARGMELGEMDFRFGDLPETLDQLINDGDSVTVELDASDNVIRIEDN